MRLSDFCAKPSVALSDTWGRRMDVLAHHALVALTEAGRRIAADGDDDGALRALAEAAATATGADAVVIRVAEPGGAVRVRVVAARSEAVAAELEGSKFPTAELDRKSVV